MGCAVGADAAVLAAAVRLLPPSRVAVWAAFGPGGLGSAGSASSVSGVGRALAAGCAVSWWAGGGLAVPLRGRLCARSVAFVRSLAASGGVLVGLVGSACPAGCVPGPRWASSGSGSWSSLALAAGLAVPVVVWPVGWVWSPPVGWLGSWSAGPWQGSWLFMPAQAALF